MQEPDVGFARAAGAFVVAVFLTACGREATEPSHVRLSSASDASSTLIPAAALWNNRIVAFESRQPNSAGATLCLDIPNGEAVSGQGVNYYPCHYGPSQQFLPFSIDIGTSEALVMVRSRLNASLCLDIRGGGTNDGARLQLFPCQPWATANSNQKFLMPPATLPSLGGVAAAGPLCVQNGFPNMVLDIPLPVWTSGAVQQFRHNGGVNQLWRFRDVPSGMYFRSPSGSTATQC